MKRYGLAAALGILLALDALSYRGVERLSEATVWVAQTRPLREALREVRTNLVDVESRRRGVVLIGDAPERLELEASLGKLGRQIEELRRLTTDNLRQRARLRDLAAAVSAEREEIDWELRAPVPPRGAAGAAARGLPQASLADRPLAIVRQMYDAEMALLATHEAETQHNARVLRATIGVGSGLAAILVIVATALLLREQGETRKAQAVVAQSAAHLRSVLDGASQVAITATDEKGVLTLFSAGAERMLGYSAEEVLGSPPPPPFHLATEVAERTAEISARLGRPAEVVEAFDRHLGERGYDEREWTYVRKDGTHLTIELSLTGLRDGNGRFTGFLGVAKDVTQRKRLEEQVAERNRELRDTTTFLRSVLDSSTEYSIIALDLEGVVLSWNEGARRNYGWTAEEMVGRGNVRLLHAPEDVESGRIEALLETARKTAKAEGEFERVRRDGTRFPASVGVTLRNDSAGNTVGYLLISKDISFQRAMEERLRRQNEELQQQYRRAQEASRLKSEFLANMSHELRTPLNAIIGFSELLHDGKAGPVSDEQKEFLGDVLTSSRHLLQLINDVLDLSKVESGKLEFRPEPVDVGRLLGEVRDILRSLAASKRIALSLEVEPGLSGVVIDPARLKQVLYNYLSNAIKFTPKEGRVVVRAASDGPDRVRIEVEDTGIGIRDEDLGKLFEEFQQLDASAGKQYPGTGLGLALTRRIVEAQGGQVGVRSEPGKGSLFFAVLPRVTPGKHSAPTRRTGADPRTHPGAPAILVVEDEARDREWITTTLSDAGYAVESVETGEAAKIRLRERVFDAITLDLLLPDTDGLQVLRALPSGPNQATPVVIVSVVAQQGLAAGFRVHDILGKPVSRDELFSSLRRAGVAPGAGPILIVDDDPRDLKLAERALQDLGYVPRCRSDGEAALFAAAEEAPAAVIVDLLMPGMDGFEFLRRFRLEEHGCRVPVIVWTAKGLDRSEREKLLGVAEGVVPKSAGAQALVEELRRLVPRGPSRTAT